MAAPTSESRPWWTLIGPGLATIIGMYLLTVVYSFGGMAPIQRDLGFSTMALLMVGVVAYLIAAVIGFALGFLPGARFPTAATLSAVVFMLVGVLLVAFTGNAGMLLAGRVLSGLGAGTAAGVTTALVGRLGNGRTVAAAVVAGAGVLAAVVAPLVSLAISSALSFRVTFLAVEPFLFVALIATAITGIILLSTTRRPAARPYTSYPN
jgi:MFS family permease